MRALLLQTVNVCFGEDTALASHRVELDVEIIQLLKLLTGQLQLGVNLVYDCPGSPGALVVHAGNFALVPRLLVGEPDDNLGVLTAEDVAEPGAAEGAPVPRDMPVRAVMDLLADRAALPVQGGGRITREAVLARLIDPRG